MGSIRGALRMSMTRRPVWPSCLVTRPWIVPAHWVRWSLSPDGWSCHDHAAERYGHSLRTVWYRGQKHGDPHRSSVAGSLTLVRPSDPGVAHGTCD